MVGFTPESDSKLRLSDYMTAGAASGSITRCLFQPFDVLKIRLQLQVDPVKASSLSSKYRGLVHATKCIYIEEGIGAFWKGLVPAQYLSMSYGAFQFLSFEVLTKQSWHLLPTKVSEEFKPVINFTCGSFAGCIATITSFPFDVIRTRLVGQGEPKIYKGLLNASKHMLMEEGPRSFFKGLLPTLTQIAPHAGAQFAFYKFFEELWNFITGKTSSNVPGAMQASICGAGAGTAAKIAIYPLDLIKKRLQIQGFEKARIGFGTLHNYNGFFHCVCSVVKKEGFLGLYKGLTPSIYKAALTTGSHFLFYEEICKLLKLL